MTALTAAIWLAIIAGVVAFWAWALTLIGIAPVLAALTTICIAVATEPRHEPR